MNTSNTGLMNLLVKDMSYLNQKESVHAENVANASTPGYKAREIQPFTFGDALKQASVGMAVTDARHIVPASMAGVNASTYKVTTTDALPDGNAVDLDQEAMAVSQTAVQYQLVTSLYHKFMSLFSVALKGS